MKFSRGFSLGRIWAILVKEVLQIRRDRLTLAMIIGVPLMQLTLFGFAINFNPKALPTAVSIADCAPTHSSTACAPPVSVIASSATPSPRPLTTSVAPSRRASASRCSWWPITVTLSAPSRRAASTAHSPTAPSPTTTTR